MPATSLTQQGTWSDSAGTPLSRPVDAQNPLAANVRNIQEWLQQHLFHRSSLGATAASAALGHSSSSHDLRPYMLALYQELPHLCRKLFGGPPPLGPGQLELAAGQANVLVDLLKPESPLAQCLFRASVEPVFFDVGVDALPPTIKNRVLSGEWNRLPKVYRERLQMVGSASGSTAFGPSPNVAGGTRTAVLRLNMCEYFLCALLEFAVTDFSLKTGGASQFQQPSPSPSPEPPAMGRASPSTLDLSMGGLKKAASLLSTSANQGLFSIPTSPSTLAVNHSRGGLQQQQQQQQQQRFANYKRKPMFNGVYQKLIAAYLDYMLPLPQPTPTKSSDRIVNLASQEYTPLRLRRPTTPAPSATLNSSIFECAFLDRNDQVRISSFFIQMLCELWMGQNEYYISLPSFEPTLAGEEYHPPSADLVRMIQLVERHVLKLDLEELMFSLQGSPAARYRDDLALYDPVEAARREAYLAFRPRFFQLLRLLFDFEVRDVSVRLMFDMWATWLEPWKAKVIREDDFILNPAWKYYVADNLLFYTTLFSSYLHMLSVRIPVDIVVGGLSNSNLFDAAPLLDNVGVEDLHAFQQIVQDVYFGHENMMTWLWNCEVTAQQANAQSLMQQPEMTLHSPVFGGTIDRLDEEARKHQAMVRQNYQEFELSGMPSATGSNSSMNWNTPGVDPKMRSFMDLRAPLRMGEGLQHMPALRYHPVFLDEEVLSAKKLVKKLIIISVVQDLWQRRYAKQQRDPSPRRSDGPPPMDTPTKIGNGGKGGRQRQQETARSEKSTTAWLVDMVKSLVAEDHSPSRGSVESILGKVRSQKELVASSMRMLESLFPQITKEEKDGIRAQMEEQVKRLYPSKDPRDQEDFRELFHAPETEPDHPMRLTHRGRQQLRTGARKCTNQDVLSAWNPANVDRLKSTEISFLVPPLVHLGLWLNQHWSPRWLTFVEQTSGGIVRIPLAVHELRWERFTRSFADRSNLLFLVACLWVLWLWKRVFGW